MLAILTFVVLFSIAILFGRGTSAAPEEDVKNRSRKRSRHHPKCKTKDSPTLKTTDDDENSASFGGSKSFEEAPPLDDGSGGLREVWRQPTTNEMTNPMTTTFATNEQRRKENRPLLVMDVDETMVHTGTIETSTSSVPTDDPPLSANESADATSWFLDASGSLSSYKRDRNVVSTLNVVSVREDDDRTTLACEHFVAELRPGILEFLDEASKFFDLAICSIGMRPYVARIVAVLDPDGSLFGDRILDREDLNPWFAKRIPSTWLEGRRRDRIVVVDDQPSVWSGTETVVKIAPFEGTRATSLAERIRQEASRRDEKEYVFSLLSILKDAAIRPVAADFATSISDAILGRGSNMVERWSAAVILRTVHPSFVGVDDSDARFSGRHGCENADAISLLCDREMAPWLDSTRSVLESDQNSDDDDDDGEFATVLLDEDYGAAEMEAMENDADVSGDDDYARSIFGRGRRSETPTSFDVPESIKRRIRFMLKIEDESNEKESDRTISVAVGS